MRSRLWICGLAALLVGCPEEKDDTAGDSGPVDSAVDSGDTGVEDSGGDTGPVHGEESYEYTAPSIDVLWVIDNSCSMEDEQLAITQGFEDFISYFTVSGADYHIGVVSTDMDAGGHSGRLQGSVGASYIDTSMSEADAIAAFQQNARLGVNGSGDERGRDAAYAALTDPLAKTYNSGFYRPDASLAIVVVSDEDDHSRDTSSAEFSKWLTALKTDSSDVQFFSIVGPDDGSCGGGIFSDEEPGTEYLAVTDAVGGESWPICTTDWSSVLTELAEASGYQEIAIPLSQAAVAGTIELTATEPDGTEVELVEGTDFTYDEADNTITVAGYVAPSGTTFSVTYEVAS